jgi:hypothetical protein
VVSFTVSKDTCRSFIVWIAGFVFVSDAETDDSKLPVCICLDEIFDASNDSICKLIHEAILMELLRIRTVRDETGFKKDNEASWWIGIDERCSARRNCRFDSTRFESKIGNLIVQELSLSAERY